MRKQRNLWLALALCLIAAVCLLCGTAFAADYQSKDWLVEFNGNRMSQNFSSDAAICDEPIQSGDTLTIQVRFRNTSSNKTNWYLRSTIPYCFESSEGKEIGACTLTYNSPSGPPQLLYDSFDENGKVQNHIGIGSFPFFSDPSHPIVFFGDSLYIFPKQNDDLSATSVKAHDWVKLDTLTKGQTASLTLVIHLNDGIEGDTNLKMLAGQKMLSNLRMQLALSDVSPAPVTPTPVTYVVYYRDADTGKDIYKPQAFIGDVGAKPVIEAVDISGYRPNSYSLTKTLVSDSAQNVFVIDYTKLPEKQETDNLVYTVKLPVLYSDKKQTIELGAEGEASLAYKSSNKSVKVSKKGVVTIPAKFIGKATVSIVQNKGTKVKVIITVKPPVITPKATNSKGKKTTVTWKKNTSVDGYTLRYTTDKKLKKDLKTVTIKKNTATKYTIFKLTKGKTYYVQMQTYKGKLTSDWSKAQKVTIKK